MAKNISNPYVGLRPFNSDESLLFFGRNQQTIEILQRLHHHRFVAVVGGSGSGKSSLIKAGVIPYLKAGFLVDDIDRWHITSMKPGRDPLYNLVYSIYNELLPDSTTTDNVTVLLNSLKENGAPVLTKFIKEHSKNINNNVFLLVDQFEELFRYSLDQNSKDDSIDFINILLELSNQTIVPIYIILTMRSDFIGDCAQFHGLPEAMNDSQYLVPKLTRQQLKMVIEGPAKLYGKTIDQNLVSRLINDLNHLKDELPLLQHALMRMWENNENKNHSDNITIEDYKDVGSLERALSNHADKAFEELNSQQKELAKSMFKALTTIDENGRKIRRPLLLGNLKNLTKATKDELMLVANKFIEENRSFLIMQTVGASEEINIDISHESLIRQWKTLNVWVDEEAKSAETYIQLAKYSILKENNQRDYLDDIELALAKQWKIDNNPTLQWSKRFDYNYQTVINYLEESDKAAKRRERIKKAKVRKIQILMASVIGLLLLVLVAGYWYMQREDLRNNSKILYFQAASLVDQDPTLAYRLQKEAFKMYPDSLYNNSADTLKKYQSFYKIIGTISGEKLKEGIYSPNSTTEDGKYTLVIDSLNQVRIIDSAVNDVFKINKTVLASSFESRSNTLFYGTDERKLYSYNISNKSEDEIYTLIDDEISSISLGGENQIYIGTNKGHVKVFNKTGEQTNEYTFLADQFVQGIPIAAISKIAVNSSAKEFGVLDRMGRAYFKTKDDNVIQIKGNTLYRSAVLASNGNMILGLNNGTISQVDQAGNSLSSFKAHEQAVTYIGLIGGDNYILSATNQGVIIIWDLEGNKKQEFLGHTKSIYTHRISDNGTYLISYSYDGTIRKWKLRIPISGGMNLKVSEQLTNSMLNLKDGEIIWLNKDEFVTNVLSPNVLNIINLSIKLQNEVSVANACSSFIKTFKLSPDKSKVIINCSTGRLSVYNFKNGELIYDYGDIGIIKGLAFSPDGESILTGSLMGTVTKWDLSGNSLKVFPGHTNGVSAITLSEDQSLMAVSADNHTIKIWDLTTEDINNNINLPSGSYVSTMAFTPDKNTLVIGMKNGDFLIYNIFDNQIIKTVKNAHPKSISNTIIDEDATYILLQAKGGDASVYNFEGRELKKLNEGSLLILASSIIKNTQKIISISSSGQLKTWDMSEKESSTAVYRDEDIEELSKEQKRLYGIK